MHSKPVSYLDEPSCLTVFYVSKVKHAPPTPASTECYQGQDLTRSLILQATEVTVVTVRVCSKARAG